MGLPDPRVAPSTGDRARLTAAPADPLAAGPARVDLAWVTTLTRRTLRADAALLTVLDDDRQHFLSRRELDRIPPTLDSTRVSRSLCRIVVEQDAPLVVHDTAHHRAFADHPALTELGVAAYAGVPLHAPGGRVLGVLCVLGWIPRIWSGDDLADLGALAVLVQDELELSARRRADHAPAAAVGATRPAALLGLPGSGAILDALEAAPQGHPHGGLASVQIDRFEEIVAALGRPDTERLLTETADRLTAVLPHSALLAYAGGGRFLALLPVLDEPASLAAHAVAAQLRQALACPELGAVLTAAVGVAAGPFHGMTPRRILGGAGLTDLAERPAAPGTTPGHPGLDVARQITDGLVLGHFALHYQPIVDLQTGRIAAYEALLRWEDPDRGLIPPPMFLPVAERLGVMPALTRFVVRTACAQLQAWVARGFRVPVAINASPHEALERGFPALLAGELAAADADASLLVVELTEGMAEEGADVLARMIATLAEIGVRTALDDFGAEHSGLRRLRALPMDFLKIDRRYLDGVPEDERACAIIDAVAALGQAVGTSVVAEGVETAAQHEFVRAHGCRHGQGWYYGRPAAPGNAAPPYWPAGARG